MLRKQLMAMSIGFVSLAALTSGATETRTVVQQSLAEMKQKAFASRQRAADLGFERFKQDYVYKEPFEDGVYIVNGDTPITSEDALHQFYLRELKAEWKTTRFGLPLGAKGIDLIRDASFGSSVWWNDTEKRNLSYCVSRLFGNRHAMVSKAFRSAADAWEAAANIKFRHEPAHDANCNSKTQGVVFDVRPVPPTAEEPEYLARAFFPREERRFRNVLISTAAFGTLPGKATLEGILRHEIGHILSFRHEHTRPEARTCFEDGDWVKITDYDQLSVMHYPDCNGAGDFAFTLSTTDKFGVACVYGSAPGLPFDQKRCTAM